MEAMIKLLRWETSKESIDNAKQTGIPNTKNGKKGYGLAIHGQK